MPKPKSNETESEFVSRCMADSEMSKYEQKQRLAICYSYYRNRKSLEKELKQKLEEYLK